MYRAAGVGVLIFSLYSRSLGWGNIEYSSEKCTYIYVYCSFMCSFNVRASICSCLEFLTIFLHASFVFYITFFYRGLMCSVCFKSWWM